MVFVQPLWVNAEDGGEFIYNDHGKRDPFWTLVSSTGAIINYENEFEVSDLNLQGIMVDATGANLAIINGNILRVNDKLGQFIVFRIDKTAVVLQQGGQEFTLELKKKEE